MCYILGDEYIVPLTREFTLAPGDKLELSIDYTGKEILHFGYGAVIKCVVR